MPPTLTGTSAFGVERKPSARSSLNNQHRNFRVRQDLVCHAAKHNRGQSAASVRCHDDEIAAPVRGRCNDGFIGLHVFHLNRIAGHTGLLGRIGHVTQHGRCVFLICSVCLASSSAAVRPANGGTQAPNCSTTIMTVTLAPTNFASDNPCVTARSASSDP